MASEQPIRPSLMLRAAMHLAFAQEARDLLPNLFTAADFTRMLAEAIDGFGITTDAVCEKFETTKASVSRWKAGNAAPPRYMQGNILEWLASEVEKTAGVDEARNRIVALLERAVAV